MNNLHNNAYYKAKPKSGAKKKDATVIDRPATASEKERVGHPILDSAVAFMKAVTGGASTTKKASNAYAERNKNRINKKVKKAGG